MDRDSAIDRHLTININKRPMFMHDAMVFAIDTLDTAWIATQSLFKDKATPEIAVQLYDRIIAKYAEKHAEYQREMDKIDQRGE